ncbi:hypothetical protein ACQX25_11715 [Corynebacterium diphtheriae]|nr:hypothetical protein [Corynebacterium diphtheriae]
MGKHLGGNKPSTKWPSSTQYPAELKIRALRLLADDLENHP